MSHTWYRLGAIVTCVVIGIGVYCLSIDRVKETFCFLKNCDSKQVVTPYGTMVVTEPVLIELFDSPALERIKHVYQYGIRSLIDGYGKCYTRYEHSVGVWALLRLHGANLEEQIAGLLHDASHTVFSHVGDFLFKQADCRKSYQDDIHERYLEKMGVGKILSKYGIRLEDIVPKGDIHKALDQELPNLCADRIEYNIQEGLMAGLLCEQDVCDILADLKFEQGQWFFTNAATAAKIARVSLHGSRYIWGGPASFVVDSLTAQALRRALDIQLITSDDVHYSVDEIVWDKLCQSKDSELIDLVAKIKDYTKQYTQADQQQHDMFVRSKFRGVDPLVQCGDGCLKRLTELDALFVSDYLQLKGQIAQGWYIKFIPSESIQSYEQFPVMA